MVCNECNKKQQFTCVLCKKKGGSPMVTVGRYAIPFHVDCFKCSDCEAQLDPKGDFVVKGNKLFTMDCYKKSAPI